MAHSRRDFLKIAAMLSGAAGVSGFVPDSIQRAFAIEPAPGSTYMDAEHIVILMQENRSFDHAMGSLQGVRGFNDPRAVRQANGNSVFVQTDAAGNSYAPWRLDIKDTRVTWMGSVPHSRNSQVDAWNGGHQDGWIEAKRSHVAGYGDIPLTMGHYTREDVPFYYALADAFTVCDQHYASVMTSTTPNRSVFWTGTVRDKQRVDSRVYMRNEEYERGGLQWKTYPERLHDAGVSWKLYQNDITHSGGMSGEEHAWLGNFGTNPLENFVSYNVEAYPGAAVKMKEQIASLTAQVAKLEKSLAAEKDANAAAKLRTKLADAHGRIDKLNGQLAHSGAARYAQLTEPQRRLHHAAFTTNSDDPSYHSLAPLTFEEDSKQQQMMVPKGDVLYQFRKDVEEGKLPTVSWLSAPEKFSDHPTSPWYGAWYVSEVMDILTKNPEVWKKTIFILTYDENDGYFDHAPSFVAADPKRSRTGRASAGIDTGLEYTSAEDEVAQGVAKDEARGGPIGMGFRVPMVVASPWTRGGWVNSQLFDHTSTLMFLEHFVQNKYNKSTTEENISAWRRAISGDLTSVFRPHDAKEAKLAFLNRDKFVISIQQARYKELPSNFKKLTPAQIAEVNNNLLHTEFAPHQEKGIRPACALPYELYAEGALSADGTKFALRMTAADAVHGKRSMGAPFNVYLHNAHGDASAGKGMLVATYTVKAGDTLHEDLPLSLFADGHYAIDVHGPNGFFRSFTGDAQAPAVQVETAYARKGASLTGDVQVKLHNSGTKPVTVAVKDNSYKSGTVNKTIAAGQTASVELDLKKHHGWYDFTVQTEGSTAESRFAGRVETGRSSFSDPLMGGMVS